MQPLERVPQNDRMWMVRVLVAGMQPLEIEPSEHEPHAAVRCSLEDGRIDAGGLTVLPLQRSPILAPVHELVGVELNIKRGSVRVVGSYPDLCELGVNARPSSFVGDGRSDVVAICRVRLVNIGIEHGSTVPPPLALKRAPTHSKPQHRPKRGALRF